MNIKDIVKEYRNKTIEGVCINLVPINESHFERIVNLRNKDRNVHSFNQTKKLTIDDQKNWYEAYLKRDDDIYWAIFNKSGILIGAIRVYDIKPKEDICEQGSFMIDEDYADEAPYAIEAMLMSYDFIFNVLKVNHAINQDREDNKVMNSLSKKLGFEFVKTKYINGVPYNYLILKKETYEQKRAKFAMIIDYWRDR